MKYNSTNYVVLRVYEIDFSIRQALISWKWETWQKIFLHWLIRESPMNKQHDGLRKRQMWPEERCFWQKQGDFTFLQSCLNTLSGLLCTVTSVPLHHVHRRATKVIMGETLGLFPIVKQRLREDVLVLSKHSQRGAEEQLKNSLGMRRNGYKMTASKFKLEIGEGC